MSDDANSVTIHGYPPIPSEIPTTKDGWRQRAIGLKLRLSAAESQNQALQERAEKAEALLRRLHGWDIMDVTADGPYWQREIDQLLSPTQETDPG